MLSPIIFCLLALTRGVYSVCVDHIPCAGLQKQYCTGEYETQARQLCTKHCGYCQANDNSANKRSHNNGPAFIDHCWDNSNNHVQDPFCALLTTTLPPTTPRQCAYEVWNETNIKSTDFGMDKILIQNNNISLNQSVLLIGDIKFCESVCEQSKLNDGFECWGFTYNSIDRCLMYYYNRPLYVLDTIHEDNTTTLYLKRCSNDPPTTARLTTIKMNGTETFATTVPSGLTKLSSSSKATIVSHTSGVVTGMVSSHATLSTDSNMPGHKSTESLASPTGISHEVTTVSGGGEPNTRGPTSGVTIVSTTTYKMIGGRSPTPGMCYFKNMTFNKGEHWTDTCKYDCQCFDPMDNSALCVDICPHYTKLQAVCTLITDSNQCCPKLDCGNHTELLNTTILDGGISNITEGCNNAMDNCDFYEDEACKGVYEPWARAHCALRCGFCDYKEPCVDRLSFCNLYELKDACSSSYRGWARYNCKRSCQMCT